MSDSFTVPGHGLSKVEITLRKTDPGDPYYMLRTRWSLEDAVTIRFSHKQMEKLSQELNTLVERANEAMAQKAT